MAPLPQPDLPEPAHPTVDSMLSRKFGKEVANYFSGSPLNRVSFLRPDHTFLSSALRHSSATFILFKNIEPLVSSPTSLARVSYADVEPIIGKDIFHTTEEDVIAQYNSDLYIPQIVFLGLDERKEGFVYKEHYKGQPWFAVDVTPKGSVKEEAEKLISRLQGKGLDFSKGRMHLSLPAEEAAIYAEARHLLDWNARNPFCASCGYKTLSVNAGFKRTCPPKDIAAAVNSSTPGERPPCATRTGVSNLCFPRTDPTVIMAVVSADGKRVLLGRQKRWPQYWYSTLAGFLEPAESVEEAVRREVWEESGVHLGRVVIHSTQPWPYPANLMIGAIGQAIPGGETVHLGHDAELEDAKWFEQDELREALRVGTSGLGEEPGPEWKEGGLRLPPKTAIAYQLISAMVNGFASGSPMI
ncbi:peroxisomal NADH pyrophosphatase-like protein NUDT12 [Macroventuria anomochaeta]|uniref:Peroxisomal NADH pyrophosphatase-like protein NUDT12 n=1 Tax=Macroventuria anomochaeta TaxID=301207 RepID=A0ACB6RZF7_9PLEO|nr:peroxisomal NADH pyrophosphatase-like protein NUDT12 [Macroventuria anomochaeta]KAF2626652.1 peroxisomal NADH pyrophosphatase-like protein NUDT12 [Macroventuria anomochaeta]